MKITRQNKTNGGTKRKERTREREREMITTSKTRRLVTRARAGFSRKIETNRRQAPPHGFWCINTKELKTTPATKKE